MYYFTKHYILYLKSNSLYVNIENIPIGFLIHMYSSWHLTLDLSTHIELQEHPSFKLKFHFLIGFKIKKQTDLGQGSKS